MSDLPALSGLELMKLLEGDGWEKHGEKPHGTAYSKEIDGEIRVTTIPRRSKSLAPSTLNQILGPKQSGLGRKGLQRLLEKKRKKSRKVKNH